ncbi:hypothetical protein [Chryseobacterium sp. 7]|uniref:hypothetical protein n=1 Tax=Chryseobacterium sp. 7 TaxID=2035214 RepID=UPI0029394ADF|nr:hypothetical protein [Chryseobacterium sp. 7]
MNEFSDLTKKILLCNELENFSELMMIHEHKIADFLEISTVKEKFFSDCPSFVKSLGAWGGDFVMSAKFGDYKNYFWEKGFTTVFEWQNIIDL